MRDDADLVGVEPSAVDGTVVYVVVNSDEYNPRVYGVFTERWRAVLAAGQNGADVVEHALSVGDGGVRS